MSGPLIHVGYHRTGTSWLQRHVFASPALGFASPFRREIAARLVLPHALDFDAKETARGFEAGLREAEQQGRVAVLSAERLSGNPHSGGYDSRELADRLCEVFPAGRVLIVVREQRSMLRSTWARYVRAGGPRSLESYLQPSARERLRVPLFDLDHFRYHRLIRHYTTRLGRSRVLVLAYEAFRDDPRAFLAAILRFASARAEPQALDAVPWARRENASLSALGLGLRRISNPVAARGPLNPWVLLPVPALDRAFWHAARGVDRILPAALRRAANRRLDRRIARVVGRHYAQSNRETAALTGLDLARLGYDVAD